MFHSFRTRCALRPLGGGNRECVNLEVDIIARYVQRILSTAASPALAEV